jgi:F-box and WD-40 domain protein 1/11
LDADADDAPTTAFAPGSEAFYRHLIQMTVEQGVVALRHALQAHPQILRYDYLAQAIAAMPTTTQQAMNIIVEAATEAQSQLGGAGGSSHSLHHPLAQAQGTPTTSTQIPNAQPAAHVAPQQPTTAPAPALLAQTGQPVAHAHHQAGHHHLPSNMARVFKLQFDARRIICCSQTSIIVGWDFANGDEQITEASRFFAPIE